MNNFKEIEFIDNTTILVSDSRDVLNQIVLYYDQDPKVSFRAKIIAVQTGLTSTEKDIDEAIQMCSL